MTYWYPTAFSHWGYEEQAAFFLVLESGRFTRGPECEAFEAEFAAYNQRKHCIFVNSGSSANLIAVAALKHCYDVCFDTYTYVPAIAWATTYAPLIQIGANLNTILDVDETWNAPIPTATRVPLSGLIVGCSILGNPGYLAEIERYAQEFNLSFLNDNCESLGATLNGLPTGKYGDIATCSFFHSHQLSAIEGGAILTDDDDLARLCRLLHNHGNEGWGKPDFNDQYDFSVFGYNVRGLELHAAIAREQLKKLDGFVDERRKNWVRFADLTDDMADDGKLRRPFVKDETAWSPFGLHFCVESKDVRTTLASALRSQGIDCRLPTGGSFTRHQYGAPWRNQPTPNADRIHDTGMFLGNAPYDITDKIERAVKVMRDVL